MTKVLRSVLAYNTHAQTFPTCRYFIDFARMRSLLLVEGVHLNNRLYISIFRAREREAERQKVSGTSVNYYASKLRFEAIKTSDIILSKSPEQP